MLLIISARYQAALQHVVHTPKTNNIGGWERPVLERQKIGVRKKSC